ncbi:MAG: hypothetical protein IJH57_01885 [Mogibacterium sp.]|nr:hypothetical protein [Mogibacterium sp.]
MKNIKKYKNPIIITLLSFVMLIGSPAALLKAQAADASWDIDLEKVSGNSALGQESYRAMQGIGFDTYTGKDGYVFMEADNAKTYKLSHFTMDENGFCTKQKSVTFNKTNVGHANDATVYQDANGVKWLIFAACGTFSEDNTTKATDGSKVTLGAIKLSDYNAGKTTVYSCDVSALVKKFQEFDSSNKGNITGVTYKGKDYVDGELRSIFIVMNAKAMYEAYVTESGNKLTFKPTGVFGRINKPTLPTGGEADTQGIAYHNQYIYLTGEGKDSKAAEMVVARISTEELFNDGNPRDYKDMEVFKKDYKTNTVSKHGAEAAFFTSLNKKSNLYVGVNIQKGEDADEIQRTSLRF